MMPGAARAGNRLTVVLTGTVALSLSSLATGPMAVAQERRGAASEIALDEITVTGENTQRSLQRTASSVTVLSAGEVKNRPDAGSFADIMHGIPNVLQSSTTTAPVIRGIDTNGPLIGGDAFLSRPIPRATISIDGRYLSSSEFGIGAAPIWDVKSIEVFRGPQTTAQGASSIAGAVVIDTKDPSFSPEAEGQILYGSRNKRRASFVLSGPLTPTLAARAAVDYSGRDTFIKYTSPNFTARDKNFDFQNLDARFKLLWQPTDLPGLEAKLTYAHTTVRRPSNEAASMPYRQLKNRTIYMDNLRTNADVGILDINYDFGNSVKLYNQTLYSSSGHTFNFAAPFSGVASRDARTFSHESRVNFGDEQSRWSGLAGIYYSRESATNQLNNLLGWADADLTHDSLGVFSELTWRFAERWALTGGLRYQYDRLGHDGRASYVPGVHYVYGKSFDTVLPKLSLSHDITPNVTVGAMMSSGHAPGGTGLNFYGGSYYTFKPEKAWNYEIFGRAKLLDNRLVLTGNLFYTDYRDFQSSVMDYLNGRPIGSVLINADKAESYGTELGADYRIFDNLRLRGRLGLLHTEISKFADYRGNSFEGKEFGKAPGYMFSLGADWNITEKLRLSGDLRHTDRYFSNDQNAPELRVRAFTVANFRLSYTPTEKHELFAYVNNAFDARVPTLKSSDRMSGGTSAFMLEPREIGVGLKARF